MSGQSKIEELLALRKALGFNQNQMAHVMDVSLREYQALEWGEKDIHDLFLRALERIAMQYAVHLSDPRLIPQTIRDEIVKLAKIVTAAS
jgi:transcriptional regulator with XRE-family HTH domain